MNDEEKTNKQNKHIGETSLTTPVILAPAPPRAPSRAPEISANSPIWNAAVAARCSSPNASARCAENRIPHLLSPGSPCQSSSEDMSIDGTSSAPIPPHVHSANSADIIQRSYFAQSHDRDEEESLHNNVDNDDDGDDDDIELGTPVVSFEEDDDTCTRIHQNGDDDQDGTAPVTTLTSLQTPPPRQKPSLTINTRDIWEEHCGKKASSDKTKTFHLETPSTVATTPTSPSDSVYTIEHKHTYKRSKKSKVIAFSKPLIAIAGIVVVALTGGGAFLLSEWFTIPGLTAQIEELQTQVKLLTAQVDRLEEENDRFSQLNDRLEEENTVFASEIVKFNNTNALYAELNVELADLTSDNMRLNEMLNASNTRYKKLNLQLDETKNNLQTQVGDLSVENTKLDTTVASYAKENQILEEHVDRLESINEEFASKVDSLNSTATILSRENNRLSALNDDLRVVASFLNETAGTLVDSYEDIAGYLARQIDAGRAIWTRTTQNLYRARTNNMVCDIQSRFSGQSFVVNPTIPIGDAHYSEVIEYVDETMLSELCIRREEFEAFLLDENIMMFSSDVTLNDVVRSLTRYNMMVFDYYFPRDTSRMDGGEFLTNDDWSAANYRCEELPVEKRFVWPMVVPQPKSENKNGDM
eukprot:CAMPEP_0181026438 /NCGR_PEP_ID=MMETSP1070-20121207/3641_1 /TAXON_ID=265543 /ORGANISM="Minutocellus polymorphus, Strain NH13" /LENGTH=641 /DNA_ID=CAMNT_0023103633 /DNA_START=71 /DNA_END=1996 /DNA_ORIENTATION=+